MRGDVQICRYADFRCADEGRDVQIFAVRFKNDLVNVFRLLMKHNPTYDVLDFEACGAVSLSLSKTRAERPLPAILSQAQDDSHLVTSSSPSGATGFYNSYDDLFFIFRQPLSKSFFNNGVFTSKSSLR